MRRLLTTLLILGVAATAYAGQLGKHDAADMVRNIELTNALRSAAKVAAIYSTNKDMQILLEQLCEHQAALFDLLFEQMYEENEKSNLSAEEKEAFDDQRRADTLLNVEVGP